MKFCYVVREPHSQVSLCYDGGMAMTTDHKLNQWLIDDLEDNGFYAERKYMETHSFYKQVIPVIVLHETSTDRYVFYQRKANHTETRLAGKWTVGFGGHIDPEDSDDNEEGNLLKTQQNYTFGKKISSGFFRELFEETGIRVQDTDSIEFKGFIHDHNDAVGKVHLGLCFVLSRDVIDMELINSQSEVERAILLKAGGTGRHAVARMVLNEEDGKLYPMELEGWANIILGKL